jgi:hypothetical protein
MSYAPLLYTGNGTTTDYNVSWPYMKKGDVHVYVGGVEASLDEWPNSTTVRLLTAPANGAKVKVVRITSDSPVAFVSGAIKNADLNSVAKQGLYAATEARGITDMVPDYELGKVLAWDPITPNKLVNASLITSNATLASQAQAQAGLDNLTYMSPQRVQQSIAQFAGMIPTYDTREGLVGGAKYATINTALVTRLRVLGYSTVGDSEPAVYKLATVQSSGPGKFQSADGAWWELLIPFFGIDIRCVGVVADSDHTGTTGTDQSTKLQECISIGAHTLRFPVGVVRIDNPITLLAGQTWRGCNRADEDGNNTTLSGSAIMYCGTLTRSGGSGDAGEVAIKSPAGPGVSFSKTSFFDMSFWASATNTATWIMRLYTLRSCYMHNCQFVQLSKSILTAGQIATITSITKATSAVVGYSGADIFSNGQRVRFTMPSGSGMKELNGREFIISAVDTTANTFEIGLNTSSTDYTAFVAGHGSTAQVCQLPWDSFGGDQSAVDNSYVGGRIIPSMLQGVKYDRTDTSWQLWLNRCEFIGSGDRCVVNPGQNKYLGYCFAVDVDMSDVWLNHCHFNASSVMNRMGAVYCSNSNWENVSLASDTGWNIPGCGRGAVVLRNKADSTVVGNTGAGINDIIGSFANCALNQAGRGLILDCSYTTLPAVAAITFSSVSFRRHQNFDISLIGNTTLQVSGGGTSGCTFYEPPGTSLVNPAATGTLAEPRIEIVTVDSNGNTVDWKGFRTTGSVKPLPDHWLIDRGNVVEWYPRWGATAIDTRGLNCATWDATGAHTNLATSSDTLGATTFLNGSGPRATLTSAVGANSSAEAFGDQFACWRGNAAGLGGFYWRGRFSLSATATGGRAFAGLVNSTARMSDTVNPSAVLQMIGIGWDAGSSHVSIMACGAAGPAIVEDLGASFPANTVGAVYEVIVWAPPNGHMSIRVERLDIKGVQPVVRYYTGNGNNIPGAAIRLTPHIWANTATDAVNVMSLDIFPMHLRTGMGEVFGAQI